MLKQSTRHYLSLFVAVVIVLGIALHDTKLDKMTKYALALPAVVASLHAAHIMSLRGDAHTHVERVSADRLARTGTAMTPKLPTRSDEKKYHLEVKVPKGRHPFDNYSLPVLA